MFDILRARIDREDARASMHPELRARLERERVRIQKSIDEIRGQLAALYTETTYRPGRSADILRDNWYAEENRRGAVAENQRTLGYLYDQLARIEDELYYG